MERNKKQHPLQFSLILRIGCGGYLLYLAWGLREGAFSGPQGLLFGIAMVVFALVGSILCFFSIRALARGEFRLPYETDDDPEEALDDLSFEDESDSDEDT